MTKKCIVCGADAEFKIKDTSDYYCQSCAEENFGDIAMLVRVEGEAQRLKKVNDEALDDDAPSD